MDEAQSGRDVVLGRFGTAWPAFQYARTTLLSHPVMVERIEHAIEAAGLWVLGKVDAQAFVRRDGYAIGGALQVLAFHPRFMVRLLEADASALLAAPLKFAILEGTDHEVTVSWADHVAAFARFKNSKLAELGFELAAIAAAIVMEAVGESGDPPRGESPVSIQPA